MKTTKEHATRTKHRALACLSIGQTFNRLRVMEITAPSSCGWRAIAACSCGNIKEYRLADIRSGNTKSCGCHNLEMLKRGPRDGIVRYAGGPQTKEYRTWVNIKTRTTNPKVDEYHNYGGRGIVMCGRWQNSFPAFLTDMGRAPTPKHSIDRFPNVDGNYEPGNCRWATATEQARNTRAVRLNADIVLAIRAMRLAGMGPNRIGAVLGFTNATIGNVLYRGAWKDE